MTDPIADLLSRLRNASRARKEEFTVPYSKLKSEIARILQKEGLVLARRTIAKYREELRIPTSNQRKVLY